MSVLIKGMEMPENCNACPMNADTGVCGVDFGEWRDTPYGMHDERPDWCRLIEIPLKPGEEIVSASRKDYTTAWKVTITGTWPKIEAEGRE